MSSKRPKMTNLNLPSQVSLVFFLSVVGVTSLLGNGLDILSWFILAPVRTPQNSYILSLAIADFLVGVFLVPSMIGEIASNKWPFGRTYCQFYIMIALLLCTVSVLHLVAISRDRYHVVFDTLTYRARRRFPLFLRRILLIWILAGYLIVPPMRDWNAIGDRTEIGSGLCIANTTRDLGVTVAFGNLFLPLSIIAGTYFAIHKELRRRGDGIGRSCYRSRGTLHIIFDNGSGSRSTSVGSGATRDLIISQDYKATKMLGIIVAAFALSWTPFALGYAIIGFIPEDRRKSMIAQPIMVAIGYSNSAMNPIIYGLFNTNFREGFKKILFFWRSRK
ncbi:tyramine receptor 1 isoform X2 [Folsomia candida]|uniref:tyramine receptor 1 isoform X2 n=1 Tax=Folsomia candida TaxID=158441 RepID=UPI000B8FB773|nr:tyramine receptor 1 isoform X2 [Folsomia candida]XP_035709846.1 tyramine receptor 1 isoform X2 [Folsomia candida]